MKAHSVFADWKEPVEPNFDKVLLYDMANWKVSRFFKDDDVSIKQIGQVLKKNLPELCQIFIEL